MPLNVEGPETTRARMLGLELALLEEDFDPNRSFLNMATSALFPGTQLQVNWPCCVALSLPVLHSAIIQDGTAVDQVKWLQGYESALVTLEVLRGNRNDVIWNKTDLMARAKAETGKVGEAPVLCTDAMPADLAAR